MARILYPSLPDQNYSAATWSLVDGVNGTETKPVAGDSIIITSSSGKVTCDEYWEAADLTIEGSFEAI